MLMQTQAIEVPKGGLLPDLLSNSFLQNLTVFGDVLWFVAYVFIIRLAFKDRTYGIPITAVCLNITYEFFYTFIFPPATGSASVDRAHVNVQILWLLADVFILWQILRYGKAKQANPEIRKFFYPIVVLLIGAGILAYAAFHRQFGIAYSPVTEALVINLIMSVLFVFLYFDRRGDLSGLSYAAAWFKMLGTAVIGVSVILQLWSTQWLKYYPFYVYLFIVIFIADVIYIRLLHRTRHKLAAT